LVILLYRRVSRRSVSSDDRGEPYRLAVTVLTHAREELTRADAKASIVLAASGVGAGALVAGLVVKEWTPSVLSNRVEWIWWIAVFLGAAGIACAALAVFPRTPKRSGISVLHYQDFGSMRSPEDGKRAVSAASQDSLKVVIGQLIETSRIVQRKYSWLKFGIVLLLSAALLLLLSVVLDPRI